VSDDLRASFLEVSDEQHARWEIAAAVDGYELERWVAFTLDTRAAILASRATGEMPEWWRREYG
jgi:hypothetical protein